MFAHKDCVALGNSGEGTVPGALTAVRQDTRPGPWTAAAGWSSGLGVETELEWNVGKAEGLEVMAPQSWCRSAAGYPEGQGLAAQPCRTDMLLGGLRAG